MMYIWVIHLDYELTVLIYHDFIHFFKKKSEMSKIMYVHIKWRTDM